MFIHSPISRDVNGAKPLHRACAKGRTACVEILLKAGAQVDDADDKGLSLEALVVGEYLCFCGIGCVVSHIVTRI